MRPVTEEERNQAIHMIDCVGQRDNELRGYLNRWDRKKGCDYEVDLFNGAKVLVRTDNGIFKSVELLKDGGQNDTPVNKMPDLCWRGDTTVKDDGESGLSIHVNEHQVCLNDRAELSLLRWIAEKRGIAIGSTQEAGPMIDSPSTNCPECSKPLELVNEYSEETHYNCTGCGSYIIVSEAVNRPVAEHIYLQLKSESETQIKLLRGIIIDAMGLSNFGGGIHD